MVKYLILGTVNVLGYKNVFPLIKDNKMWLGMSQRGVNGMWFRIPDDADERGAQKTVDGIRYQSIGSSSWITNMDNEKRHQALELTQTYDAIRYYKYDNYDAIEVGRVKDIPDNYYGLMGVPVSFLSKWCVEQFEIIDRLNNPCINGEHIYKRLIIRRKI